MNFISTFDELNKLYENASSKALHEGYTVKYGRGSDGVNFDSLEDAVKHINDGMQKRSQKSYVLYQDGKELIWLDWYTANRDGSDSNWSESRKAAKAPVSFDKKEGKLSVIEEALTEGDDYWRDRPYYDQSQKNKGVIKPYEKPTDYKGSQSDWERKVRDSQDTNRSLRRNPWESLDKEAEDNALLAEAAEDEEIEIVDDEAAVAEIPAEEPVVEEEPRQVICECDKCGALVIKNEADIVVDEETDLVNVEDECQFCEEAKGYKIIGAMVPYTGAEEASEEDEELVEEEPIKEGLFDKFKKSYTWADLKDTHEIRGIKASQLKKGDIICDDIADGIVPEDDDFFGRVTKIVSTEFDDGTPATEIQFGSPTISTVHATDDENDLCYIAVPKVTEDLADWYRKKFDKPASISTQQAWEDELNGEMGEISDKRRKHLEKKFAQQRDWEARHASDSAEGDLTEGFSVKYGRSGKSTDFDKLEDAVKHINDGMKNRDHDSFVLYQDGEEMIWLDWYTANRDGSDSSWSEARSTSKSPVVFDRKTGTLSIKPAEETKEAKDTRTIVAQELSKRGKISAGREILKFFCVMDNSQPSHLDIKGGKMYYNKNEVLGEICDKFVAELEGAVKNESLEDMDEGIFGFGKKNGSGVNHYIGAMGRDRSNTLYTAELNKEFNKIVRAHATNVTRSNRNYFVDRKLSQLEFDCTERDLTAIKNDIAGLVRNYDKYMSSAGRTYSYRDGHPVLDSEAKEAIARLFEFSKLKSNI